MTDIQIKYLKHYLTQLMMETFGTSGRSMDDLVDFVIKSEEDKLIEVRSYVTSLNTQSQLELDNQPTKTAKLEADITERGLV